MELVQEFGKEILFAIGIAGLSWAVNRARSAWANWQNRPSAQQRQQDELQAARTMASNTQRLIVFVGTTTLLFLQLLMMAVFLAFGVLTVADGLSVLDWLIFGFFLAAAVLQEIIFQRLEKIDDILRAEQQPPVPASTQP